MSSRRGPGRGGIFRLGQPRSRQEMFTFPFYITKQASKEILAQRSAIILEYLAVSYGAIVF